MMPNYHASVMMPRADMPQIAKKDIPDFLSWAQSKTGKAHREAQIFASQLKPTQSQINPEKVASLGATPDKILVSSDNYVLDGHHRWVANARVGNMQNAYVLPYDVHHSFELMKDYPGSFQAELNEDEAPTVAVGTGAIDDKVVIPKQSKVLRRKKLVEWLVNEYA